MKNRVFNPPEIVKVRKERETILCRLPRWFVKEHQLTGSSVLVFRNVLGDAMEVYPWEDYIDKQKKLRARARKSDK